MRQSTLLEFDHIDVVIETIQVFDCLDELEETSLQKIYLIHGAAAFK
jgi:hypothetical protein